MTDPHDGRSIGIKTPAVKADIVLVSHEHFDHNCVRIVRGDPAVVREPGERTVKGLKILGVPSFHDVEGGAKRGKNIMFKFELDGMRFCHCGDLCHSLSDEQIAELGQIDVLFIPVGGAITLDGKQARELVSRIRPRVAVPMHFRMGGLSMSIETVDRFLENIPADAVLRVGNEVDFLKEDLPPFTECWVFSP